MSGGRWGGRRTDVVFWAQTLRERRWKASVSNWRLEPTKRAEWKGVDAPSKRKEEELVRRVVETRELQFALT